MTERICIAATESGGDAYATTLIDPDAAGVHAHTLVVGAALSAITETVQAARDQYEDACDLARGSDEWGRERMMLEYVGRVEARLEAEGGMLAVLCDAVKELLDGGPVVRIRIRCANERQRDIAIAPPARIEEENARILRLDLFDSDGKAGWV